MSIPRGSQANPSLANALSSLRTSTQTLATSLQILDTGISDFGRLRTVITQTRHFELLPASTLAAAQAALQAEINPEVEALLAHVEAKVERLERREQGLRAKCELQAGRLGREAGGGSAGGGRRGSERAGESGTRSFGDGGKPTTAALGSRQELKAKQLRQKKERLSYTIERLTLQAQQAERKLRMSMAAQDMTMASLGAGEHVDATVGNEDSID